MSRSFRFIGAAAATGALLIAAAAPAAAWPTPLTPDQTQYLNAVRGTGFPGDDDQLLLAGLQACRQLYGGQARAAVVDATAAQYGASPEQASGLVNAARGTICTQAPG